MNADNDIVERLQSAGHFYAPPHDALLYEAAAEIVRLRGEVERLSGWLAVEQRASQKSTPTAPATPNGVEADMSAQLDAMTAAYERMTAYTIVHKGQLVYMSDLGRAAYSDVVAERDAALRAADNRDAAGVCDCPGIGKADKTLHAPNCPVRTAPAAVPAGEAVAWLPSAHEWLSQNQYAASQDWMEGWNACRSRWQSITTPPAPVQAAPQEGEAVGEVVAFGSADLKEVAWRKGKMPPTGTKLYAHPSACELGAVRELVKAWREQGDIEWNDKRCELTNVRGKTRHNCADQLEAALQHRGDSQEVGRG